MTNDQDIQEYSAVQKKDRIYNILLYICTAVMLIWIFLKMAGVINTPEYIKMLPALAGVLGFIIAIGKFGNILGDIQNNIGWLKKGFHRMDKRQNRMAVGLTRVEKDVEYLKKDVNVLKNNVKRINNRLDNMDNKIGRLSRCRNYKAAT
ncbi:hypothetical protein KY362_00735 [Candidatus Woesearchaeota archaeon]|nr:hypothetical protein [Candidatus Woesearchaeota archaeon]